jgi:hypothetical protein
MSNLSTLVPNRSSSGITRTTATVSSLNQKFGSIHRSRRCVCGESACLGRSTRLGSRDHPSWRDPWAYPSTLTYAFIAEYNRFDDPCNQQF